MKKLITMMLVAMVPFFTMAQKRSKRDKGKEQTTATTKASVEYMVIKGVEIPLDTEGVGREVTERSEDVREMEMKKRLKPNVKLVIYFDYGNTNQKEAGEMMRNATRYRSMVSAMNAAAAKGWEFVSANITTDNNITTHYYYLKRK